MDAENQGHPAECRTMIRTLTPRMLPQMDHLVFQRPLGFPIGSLDAEPSGYDDLQRVDRKVAVPPAHPATEVDRHIRECTSEARHVHPVELMPQQSEVFLVTGLLPPSPMALRLHRLA